MTKIINNYNTEEQAIIRMAVVAHTIAGAKAPQNEEELKAFCDNAIRTHNERVAKEAETKKKAEATKQRKVAEDAENGITPEMRKAMTQAKRCATEIEKMKAEIAKMERALKAMETKKDYWEKQAKGE